MDIAGFEDNLDRYGGDLERWPTRERTAADELLAVSSAAQALLAEMRVVEVALVRASSMQPDKGDIDRLVARASAGHQETRARRMVLRAGVGTAAAAALALGILVGGLWPAPATHDMSPDRVLAAALDTGGAGDVD